MITVFRYGYHAILLVFFVAVCVCASLRKKIFKTSGDAAGSNGAKRGNTELDGAKWGKIGQMGQNRSRNGDILGILTILGIVTFLQKITVLWIVTILG